MKLTFDAKNTKVYDEFVSEKDFLEIFDLQNFQPYAFRSSHGEWNKVWNLSDGQILMGKKYLWPYGKVPPLDKMERCLIPFIESVNKTIEHSGLFDVEQISTISLTPYCWPAETGLSWHNDSNYLGALTFYCHKYWSPEWGGEFITCEADDYIIENKEDITWKVFDNQELYDMIMDKGNGNYFYPKPNRAILNKGGTSGILHKVNRSSRNSSPRLTLQCFINKKD